MNLLAGFLKGFRRGMGDFSLNISALVNAALLSVVYAVGVGLTSVFARLVGKRFLELKPSSEAASYWSDLDLGGKPLEGHYRQF